MRRCAFRYSFNPALVGTASETDSCPTDHFGNFKTAQ
jgi:hypothetical protein